MSIASCSVVSSAATSFASGYGEAREMFLASAPGARSYPCPAPGPNGEPLFTDVAWIGPEDATQVCVIISGTHGVEAYCGSGIQLDLIRHGAAGMLGQGQALLFIHALNPYGFAWDRRVTEEGCDLNRNFVDFEAGAPRNAGYEQIADYLVPPELDGPVFRQAQEKLAEFRRVHGELAFQTARKSGQYAYPLGVFFGGFAPSSSRQRLEQISADYRLRDRDFGAIIDIHTGLGPFGYGEPQSEHSPLSRSHELALAMFGHSVTSPDEGTSYSVPIHGGVQKHFERILQDGKHVYLCLEYGTYDQERSLEVYRNDHWYHAHGGGDPNSPAGQAIRKATRQHFFPGTPDWNEMILFRARQVFRQALVGMAVEGGRADDTRVVR